MKANYFIPFIEKANKLLKGKAPIPILDNVFFSGHYAVVSTLEVDILFPFAVEQPFFINFKKFSDIVKKYKEFNISFSVVNLDEKNRDITITIHNSNRTSFNLKDDNVIDDFPSLPVIGSEYMYLNSTDVTNIKKAVNYAANDDLRPNMNNVFIDKEHIVASDGSNLCFYKTSLRDDTLLIDRNIVPFLSGDAIKIHKAEYVKEEKNNAERKHYFIFDNGLMIRYKEFTDNKYPNWEAVVPQPGSHNTYVQFKSETLKSMIDAAEIIDNTGLVMALHVRTAINQVKMQTSNIHYDSKSNMTITNVITSGKQVIFGIVGTSLKKILSVEKAEPYEFKIIDKYKGIVINNKILMMPAGEEYYMGAFELDPEPEVEPEKTETV